MHIHALSYAVLLLGLLGASICLAWLASAGLASIDQSKAALHSQVAWRLLEFDSILAEVGPKLAQVGPKLALNPKMAPRTKKDPKNQSFVPNMGTMLGTIIDKNHKKIDAKFDWFFNWFLKRFCSIFGAILGAKMDQKSMKNEHNI